MKHRRITPFLLLSFLILLGCSDEAKQINRAPISEGLSAPGRTVDDEQFLGEHDTLRFAAGEIVFSEYDRWITLKPVSPDIGSAKRLSTDGCGYRVEWVDSVDNLFCLTWQYARGSTYSERLQLIRVTDTGLCPLVYLSLYEETRTDGPKPTVYTAHLDRRTRRFLDTLCSFDHNGDLESTSVRDVTFRIDSATGLWYNRRIWLDSIEIDCLKGQRRMQSNARYEDSTVVIVVNRFVPVAFGRFYLNGHWLNLLSKQRGDGVPDRAQLSSYERTFCEELVP